ncbi:hypothetical protein Ahy_A07g034626 isoform A [Arachis hypogaea]|uniref:Uncharacterized protein n=1 Tax=Arachis hypogaea TaxID=3818 RepID=A0A445CCP9_ARAHY|nr:hypothetical protein Ahy_A07g034626 isoform A [Arachis hypogaea]
MHVTRDKKLSNDTRLLSKRKLCKRWSLLTFEIGIRVTIVIQRGIPVIIAWLASLGVIVMQDCKLLMYWALVPSAQHLDLKINKIRRFFNVDGGAFVVVKWSLKCLCGSYNPLVCAGNSGDYLPKSNEGCGNR